MTTQDAAPKPPDRDMDERVSLYPLAAEDVLRALLTIKTERAGTETVRGRDDRTGCGPGGPVVV